MPIINQAINQFSRQFNGSATIIRYNEIGKNLNFEDWLGEMRHEDT